MMRRADFVVVTAPLTLETERLVDAAALNRLKPTAGLVNMGRARIVDYEALQVRLSDGRLRGAVLDVFDPEPLPADSPLWTAPNVIITPHVSSDDEDNYGLLTIELVFENSADGMPESRCAMWSMRACVIERCLSREAYVQVRV